MQSYSHIAPTFTLRAILLLWVSCLGQALTSATLAEPVRIGVSTPLSGDAATYGVDVRNVLQFANEILAHGKYDLVFEDDRCSGTDAVSVAHSFIRRDIRAILGVVCTTSLSAAAPVYDKAGAIVLTSSANLDGISSAGKSVFATIPSDTEAMKPLSRYACPKHSTIGIISEQTEMAQQMASAFAKACELKGTKIMRDNFLASARDFRSQLTRFRHNKVEALFINTQTEASFVTVLKQIRELQLEFTLYGAFFPGTRAFLDQAGGQANGIIYVDLPDFETSLTSSGRELYAQFVRRFGPMRSIQFMFITTYESFRALSLSLESGRPPRDFLRSAQLSGLLGNYSFRADGVIDGIRHVLKQIRDGKVESIEYKTLLREEGG